MEGYPSWPVTRKELQPFYDEAASFCKLHGANFSAEYWAQVLEAKVPDLPGFEVAMYQFMGGQYLNFANRTVDGQTLADSKIDVIRNASLLSIDYQQGSAQRLNVASIESGDNPSAATQFSIRADAYVLACGAVANARQLLLSDLNQSGKVGRYFMCHPLTSGVVSVTKPYLSTDEKRLMDGTKPNGQQWTDSNGVRVTGRFIPNADTTRQLDIGRCWFWANYNHYYFEQAPNPNSYITLGDGTDPVFGQPQTDIIWEFCDLDEKTYNATTQLFQKDVSDRGGSVSFQSWSYVKANAVVNGHHLGTTRMSVDPADGVVDSNLRSHELNNLYVAGSSVWPSAGISNPTHTIIMFAIRLASHLSQEFGASGGAAD
ncbi:MAG TPA: GMC family oxidoreductase [Acidobacteriota bacterium]|nr:GMC family oxidoreductase [Acidobacteriota bacterium]